MDDEAIAKELGIDFNDINLVPNYTVSNPDTSDETSTAPKDRNNSDSSLTFDVVIEPNFLRKQTYLEYSTVHAPRRPSRKLSAVVAK